MLILYMERKGNFQHTKENGTTENTDSAGIIGLTLAVLKSPVLSILAH